MNYFLYMIMLLHIFPLVLAIIYIPIMCKVQDKREKEEYEKKRAEYERIGKETLERIRNGEDLTKI